MYKDKRAQAAFAEQGRAIYEAHRAELEENAAGQVVAIDVDSGEFVIGRTLGKANDAAYPKFPDKWLYFVRVGEPEAAIALQAW